MTMEIPKTMKATKVKTHLTRTDVIFVMVGIIYSFVNLIIFLILRSYKVLTNVNRVTKLCQTCAKVVLVVMGKSVKVSQQGLKRAEIAFNLTGKTQDYLAGSLD